MPQALTGLQDLPGLRVLTGLPDLQGLRALTGLPDLQGQPALLELPVLPEPQDLLLRQYMHNTEIAVTMRLSTILKTIKQPL